MSTTLDFSPRPPEPLPKIHVRIISEFDEDFVPAFYSQHILANNDVPGELAPEWHKWSPETPVLVCAGTGTGKTSFVLQLGLYLRDCGQKGLIISNRQALKSQAKLRYAELTQSEILKTDTAYGLQKRDWIENLRFVNYQGLPKVLYEEDLYQYSFVFFDEVQYFVADSLFAKNTGWLLKQIPRRFDHSVRIYATATPWSIWKPLAEAEEFTRPQLSVRLQAWNQGYVPAKEFLLYRFPTPPRNLRIHYLSASLRRNPTDEQFLRMVDETKGKILIFVESKAFGQRLANAIQDAVFIDRDSKKSKTWTELISQSSFTCRVLISTPVIDAGVNIIDPELRTLILFATERTRFIQELGRKRLAPGEPLDLYVVDADRTVLSNELAHLEQYKQALDNFERSDKRKRQSILLSEWYDEDATIRHLIPVRPSGTLDVNRCAEFALNQRIHILSSLLNSESEHPFLEAVHNWLDDPGGYNPGNWGQSPEEAKQEFLAFLRNNREVCFQTKDKQEAFGRSFKVAYTRAYGPRSSDRSDRPFYGLSIMRDCLKEIGSDFYLESDNKGWHLESVAASPPSEPAPC